MKFQKNGSTTELDGNMPYDQNNIFAKILRGEIPCVKVYEDAQTLAFMGWSCPRKAPRPSWICRPKAWRQ
jgi:hypothetical protein